MDLSDIFGDPVSLVYGYLAVAGVIVTLVILATMPGDAVPPRIRKHVLWLYRTLLLGFLLYLLLKMDSELRNLAALFFVVAITGKTFSVIAPKHTGSLYKVLFLFDFALLLWNGFYLGRVIGFGDKNS